MGEPPDIDQLFDQVYGSDSSRRDQALDQAVGRIEHVIKPHHVGLNQLHQQGRRGRLGVPASAGHGMLPADDESPNRRARQHHAGAPASLPVASQSRAAVPALAPADVQVKVGVPAPAGGAEQQEVDVRASAPMAGQRKVGVPISALMAGRPRAGTLAAASADGPSPLGAAAPAQVAPQLPAQPPAHDPPTGPSRPPPTEVVSGDGKEILSSRYATTQIVRRWGFKK